MDEKVSQFVHFTARIDAVEKRLDDQHIANEKTVKLALEAAKYQTSFFIAVGGLVVAILGLLMDHFR